MALKDVCFQALEFLEKPVSRTDVTKYIIDNDLHDFRNTQQPTASVSSELGSFIRRGDIRVSRTKDNSNVYLYYLTKNEPLNKPYLTDLLSNESNQSNTAQTFQERDLHKLLATLLKSKNIYSKTIYHEKNNRTDKNQIWTNPDIVGVEFSDFSDTTEQFLKIVNISDLFKLYSYEMKRELKSDNDLKEAYFQAVSNSSWASYGYLVAFNINTNLHKEIQRLNKSFGIGVIELSSNIYESKIIATARHNELDFDTINKLANTNPDFNKFIRLSRKILSTKEVEDKEIWLSDLDNFCDDILNDDNINNYCNDKNIPIENDEEL